MLITKRFFLFFVIPALAVCAVLLTVGVQRPAIWLIHAMRGHKTVDDRVEQYGKAVHERLAPEFDRIGVVYPPKKITLVGIKQDRLLEVWVSDPPRLLKTYPILGAIGTLGPKLRKGDRQVPEGLYRIESLNPNSLYHLALRVNYPNSFDKEKAEKDGRSNLGSDIMIHGKSCSVGCLAMGDSRRKSLHYGR